MGRGNSPLSRIKLAEWDMGASIIIASSCIQAEISSHDFLRENRTIHDEDACPIPTIRIRNRHSPFSEAHRPYRTLSTANQASSPPSKLHPTGPKSHSAHIKNFTFPFAPSTPGPVGGSVIGDGREKPMFSNDMGEPGMCQYAVCVDAD